MLKYSKAIIGFLTASITVGLLQIASRYGLPLDTPTAAVISAGLAGLITGAAVYAVRNAPPDLIDAIEDVSGIKLDDADG